MTWALGDSWWRFPVLGVLMTVSSAPFHITESNFSYLSPNTIYHLQVIPWDNFILILFFFCPQQPTPDSASFFPLFLQTSVWPSVTCIQFGGANKCWKGKKRVFLCPSQTPWWQPCKWNWQNSKTAKLLNMCNHTCTWEHSVMSSSSGWLELGLIYSLHRRTVHF